MKTSVEPNNMQVTRLDPGKTPRAFMGPLMVDQAIRQAIMHCWMVLPEEQQSTENVEKEIMRLVKRALKDMREDARAFSFPLKK
jgi:hypothetical protein